MSWAVRITARRIELPCSRVPASGPGETVGKDPDWPGFGRVEAREDWGIDYDLSAGILTKWKLPPVIIRRDPPFSNPVGEK
jgi:hypothetical protein